MSIDSKKWLINHNFVPENV